MKLASPAPRALLVATTLAAALLSARDSHAQESSAPSTTDCGFAPNDRCIQHYWYQIHRTREHAADEAYQTGIRVHAGFGLALGLTQTVSGIVTATGFAPPNTHGVGFAVAWTSTGILMSLASSALFAVPDERPSHNDLATGPLIGMTTVLASLSVLHAVGAGLVLARPPQDVAPIHAQLFAASMIASSLWYGTLGVLTRLDFRSASRHTLARSVTPYVMALGGQSTVGLAGRF
ncbi:MAG: hypothetical protein Q8Q09_17380 [Deltaproteobacteria bacterium]|nr:hypothetical protein [Deltaproteobacteria bacterium]